MPADKDHLEGKRVSERYRIKKVEKWTEHSTFCSAEDMATSSLVRLILLSPSLIKDEKQFAKKMQEFQSLKDKKLLAVIAEGRSSDGDFFLATENLDSSYTALDQVLKKQALPLQDAFSLIKQIVAGLHYLNRETAQIALPFPQQIFVSGKEQQMQPKINLIALLDSGVGPSLLIPEEMSHLERSRYLPPEIINGKKADERSQIYMLSAFLYQLLCGHALFDSDDIVELESQHLCLEPKRIHEQRPDLYIDPRFEAVILKGLKKDPAERQHSLLQFKDELTEALSSRPFNKKRVKQAAAVLILGLSAFAAFQFSGLSTLIPGINPGDTADTNTVVDELDPKIPQQDSGSFLERKKELDRLLLMIPDSAKELDFIKLSGSEKKELAAGDYVCNGIELSEKSTLTAEGKVRLWIKGRGKAPAVFSLKDSASLSAEKNADDFTVYYCSISDMQMSGSSVLRADVLAPLALLDAKDQARIIGPFQSNGQKLEGNASFLSSDEGN